MAGSFADYKQGVSDGMSARPAMKEAARQLPPQKTDGSPGGDYKMGYNEGARAPSALNERDTRPNASPDPYTPNSAVGAPSPGDNTVWAQKTRKAMDSDRGTTPPASAPRRSPR